MRIAFYAPMKPPTSPVPSGDRQMARAIRAALEAAGHEVELASRFRSWDGAGDAARQRRIMATGERLAARLTRRLAARPPDGCPHLWLTYHLYHKAPDWIGPRVCRALGIPYVVCEASYAPKQQGGKWALGHDAAGRAIRDADAVIGLNTLDAACVRPLLRDSRRMHQLRPFMDVTPLTGVAAERDAHRRRLASRYGLDPAQPWLLAVGMMRPGDKLDSYCVLGRALALLDDLSWQLLVVGDGPARNDVESALSFPGRVGFAGELDSRALAACYAAADLMVWPAIREAYGMALLEAQAAGLPVVAGNSGGVADIVRDGTTGLVTPAGDSAAFAAAVGALLRAPDRRAALGRSAGETAQSEHSIAYAAAALDAVLSAVTLGRAA